MMKRMTVAVALGAVCLAALAGCSREKRPAGEAGMQEAPAAVSGLRIAPAAAEEVISSRELAGSVRAVSVSQVSSRIMAQAIAAPVSEGERVVKGQVLVTLDDRELQAKLRQAESAVRQAEAARNQAASQLDLATAGHTRYRALLEGRAISRQEYDQVAAQEAIARAAVAQAEGAVAQAASAVEEARTWLAFAVITSPVTGRVTARMIDAGSMAVPGMPLFAIEQEGRYRVELPADGSLAAAIAKGTALAVSVEDAGFAGTVPVTEIVSASDAVSRTFVVKADLPADPRLASGQYARVSVPVGSRLAVVVPESALVKRGQLDGVFTEAAGRLAFRIVQAGRAAGAGKREILSGLAAGERIVVGGAERAVDGAPVASREAE